VPTWRSQTFLLPTDGGPVLVRLPSPGKPAVSVQHIPGSDLDLVQYGGKGREMFKIRVWFETAGQLNAMKALQADGTAGDITGWTVIGGTITLAGMYLEELGDPMRYVSPVSGAASTEVVETEGIWWRQSTAS
jgi:hypothetical protein